MPVAAVLTAGVLIVGFFLWERRSRQGAEAASFARGAFDRGSTTLLAAVFALGFLLLPVALLLDANQIARIGGAPVVAWCGVAVITVGIALRIWSSRVLGRFCTRTLRVSSHQEVVSEGPYRVVRHPGYLGDILMWSGAAFATLNWLAFACLTLAALLAYGYRIHVEEAMLRETLGAPLPRVYGTNLAPAAVRVLKVSAWIALN
jgi:protein-S-isoprenylcysteine O-methyltransferase Ste14